MLQINIICHGTLKEKYLRDAYAEYNKRLTTYCKLTTYEAKDDEALYNHLPKKDYKFALCVEGEQLSSEELAKKLSDLQKNGFSSISFVIGGSDGLPERTKAACDFRLSFSKMTFPHQLMRVILIEQIYRALNINTNGKYHK